jgi:hypothetical protein
LPFDVAAAADLEWYLLGGGASTLAEALSFHPALAGAFTQSSAVSRTVERPKGLAWAPRLVVGFGVGRAAYTWGIVTVMMLDIARMVPTLQAGPAWAFPGSGL